MKASIIVLFLFFSLNSFGQSSSDTIFYDVNWNRIEGYDSLGFYGFKNYNKSKEGLAIYYYGTGEIHSRQNEIDNLKNGLCIWYHKNGKKSSEGNFRKDKAIGEQLYYNKYGGLDNSLIYNHSDDPNIESYDLTKGLVKDSLISISQPESRELYRKYKNKIEISFNSGCEFKTGITCTYCDTIYNTEKNQFVVIPGPAFHVFIEAYKVLSDSNVEMISRTEYWVRDLPKPIVNYGAASDGDPIFWKETKLFVKYPPET